MNFFQRALKYVSRRRVKSILLVITFFLIGNLVILGLGISQAADNAKVLTRKSMRAAVSYEVDYDAFYNYVESIEDADEQNEAYNHFPQLDKDTAIKLSQDERVKAFNFFTNWQAYSSGFDNVPIGNEADRGESYMTDENGNEIEYKDPNIMLYATLYPNMIEMAEGTWTIDSGRFIDQDDIDNNADSVCITKELADQNNLRVGDSITLDIADSYTQHQLQEAGFDASSTMHEFEIVGIYTTVNDVDPTAENYKWMSPYESPKNIVLIPYSTYVDWMNDYSQVNYNYYKQTSPESVGDLTPEQFMGNYDTPSKVVYLLNDPLEVDQFVEDHTGDLAQYTKLNANNETFKKMARPLDTLSFFANIIVTIVIVNAVVIISLVTALTLKTREYEIGVLLSIGVSKAKVVAQLFVELLITAVIGFGIASVSGSLLAGKVGDEVLAYQTTNDAQYGDNTNDNNYYWSDSPEYFTTVTQEDMLSQYHVSVSPALIGEIFVIGAGVVLISIVIPSFMIMRLNPKQILLEQN